MFDHIIRFFEDVDQQRNLKGFLSLTKVLDLSKNNNVIIDPYSTLISEEAQIGSGNVFYPGVIIEIANNGSISIKDNNIFYPNSLLIADKGIISIGSNNQFGDGGLYIKANVSDAHIIIGDNGRYLNGVQVLGRSQLGSGTQVIGNITVQNCTLEAGESYKHPEPDSRGGLLKGFGIARNIVVAKGKVIDGQGQFNKSDIQDQSFFHPRK